MIELFDVWQTFEDGTYERVRESVPSAEALYAAVHYATSVAAVMGLTIDVKIVDGGDLTCWHWIRDKGVVFPKGAEGSLRYGQRSVLGTPE